MSTAQYEKIALYTLAIKLTEKGFGGKIISIHCNKIQFCISRGKYLKLSVAYASEDKEKYRYKTHINEYFSFRTADELISRLKDYNN